MNSKILVALMIIGIASTVAGAGTYAYFSDTETISGNTFTAGTLDLKIDRDPRPDSQNWVNGFDVSSEGYRQYINNNVGGMSYDDLRNQAKFSNLKPGAEGEQVIDIKNVGSVDGDATIDLDFSNGAGSDLAQVLEFSIYYDRDNDGGFETAGPSGTVGDFINDPYHLGPVEGSGNIASVKIEWSVPTSAGNEIQGDQVIIDAQFGLEQSEKYE
ncbi:MAG: TasA family protein [Candidatus Aenigmatarchaeota archaeon]